MVTHQPHEHLHGSSVYIGPWMIESSGDVVREHAPARTVAVISDTNVGPVAAPNVVAAIRRSNPHSRVLFREIEPGEERKTRDSWSALTDWLLTERCGRDTTIVALGGGVIGDLAGFVAATFMRGVPVIQIPTTLLAMVDASVGGKVGVDTTHGKNLVGAFHHPAAVIIDPTVLRTLPSRDLRAGYAEVLKHGAIADAEYFAESSRLATYVLGNADTVDWQGDALRELIARSVTIKATVVREDEREAGRRQILNFGHTYGHAIEAASGFQLRHGEAISIGMVLEARLAEQQGVAQHGLAEALRLSLGAARLPTEVPLGLSRPQAFEFLLGDKKHRADELRFALPSRLGQMAGAETGYAVTIPAERARALLFEGA